MKRMKHPVQMVLMALIAMAILNQQALAGPVLIDGTSFLLGTVSDDGKNKSYGNPSGDTITPASSFVVWSADRSSREEGAFSSGKQRVEVFGRNARGLFEQTVNANHELQTFGSREIAISDSQNGVTRLLFDVDQVSTQFTLDYWFDVESWNLRGATFLWGGAVNVGDLNGRSRYLSEQHRLIDPITLNESFRGSVQGTTDADHLTVTIHSQLTAGGGLPFSNEYEVFSKARFGFTLRTGAADVAVNAPSALFLMLMGAFILIVRRTTNH